MCLVLFCVVLGERKANKLNLVKFVCHKSCLNLWEKKGVWSETDYDHDL